MITITAYKMITEPYTAPVSEFIPVLLDGGLCDSFRLPEVEEEELEWDD